jgi:hypothetical protein
VTDTLLLASLIAVNERFFFSAQSYKRDDSLPMLHVARALSEAVSGPAQLAGLAQIYAEDSYILNARVSVFGECEVAAAESISWD